MDPNSIEVLRDLNRVFTSNHSPFLPLGGGTTELSLRIGDPGKTTRKLGSKDFDVAFRPASWEEFDRVVGALRAGASLEGDREDRLVHRNGRWIHLWPFGEGIAPRQRLVWRRSGVEISTMGLELALVHSRFAEVAEDLRVLLPPVPLIVFVKIVFYLSRLAGRDLADIVFCLETYRPEPMPEFPVAGTGETSDSPRGVHPGGGAFRLGKELRRLIPDPGVGIAVRFLDEIRMVHAPLIARILREEGISLSEGERMEYLFRLFAAFRRGLAP